jgi:EamA domain-containing membrane protein RarD
MPPRTFALLIASVIAAAGVTIALWAVPDLPLIALGTAALFGSLILGWRGLRR